MPWALQELGFGSVAQALRLSYLCLDFCYVNLGLGGYEKELESTWSWSSMKKVPPAPRSPSKRESTLAGFSVATYLRAAWPCA